MTATVATLVETATITAVNYRGAYNRHRELATVKPRARWNPELLPSEERRARELDELVDFARWFRDSTECASARAAWERRNKVAA